MPAALPGCCLWVAAALPLLLGASASPILDSSGEEQFSEDPSSRASPARDLQLANCKFLALALRRKAFSWKEEIISTLSSNNECPLVESKVDNWRWYCLWGSSGENILHPIDGNSIPCKEDLCVEIHFLIQILSYWRIWSPLAVHLCKEQTLCKNNTEIIVQNNLQFPKISAEDECPPHGFNKEKCLRGVSSSLYAYQAFLEYVEETFIPKEQETTLLWQSTKHLASTLKSMMNAPDTVTMPNLVTKEALSTQLRGQTGWNRKVIHYLILQDYISFMEKTVRAIRAL